MKIGFPIDKLEVNEVYEEVLSKRIVLVAVKKEPSSWDTGCKGFVYNPVKGIAEQITIYDYQLKMISPSNVIKLNE